MSPSASPAVPDLGRRALGLGFAALLAGCVNGSRPPPPGAKAVVPRPSRVLVYDFTTDWQSVALDSGMRARLARLSGADADAERKAIAAEVQNTLADTLVKQIDAIGIAASRAPAGTEPGRNELALRGRITRIGAGNETRRRLVGLGAGKSEVDASAQLFGAAARHPPALLWSFNAAANSGHTPGLALGGASAAAGHVAAALAGTAAGAASRAHAGLSDDAARLGRRIAHNLDAFFRAEGWIAASAVPAQG